MYINLVGINHRTASVDIREKAAIRAGKLNEALSLLHSYVSHGIILSTCNRTEVYTISSDGYDAGKAGLDFLKAHLDIRDAGLLKYVYVSRGKAAVEHLFRITCGLDSMIVGEYEVLGQVGHSLEASEKSGMVNLPLRHIFQCAIRAGRRVREETGISKNALSVSSVAVELALKAIGNPQTCQMVVIGAGEAGRLVAKAARDRGVSQILVTSRTKERASALAAELGGTAFGLDDLIEKLSTANMVVTCADAPHRLLTVPQVEAAMRKRPELPVIVIDIAVPRNVEPEVGQLKNVFLYNIDDLTQISELNRKQRESEVQKAEGIIDDEIAEFSAWRQALEIRPVVRALMSKAESIRSAQLNRTLKKLPPLSEEERANLEAMTKSIMTKILRDPIEFLKTNTNGNGAYPELISKLFRLEIEKE